MAFKDLKSYLASPPILSRPELEEDLYMYLVISTMPLVWCCLGNTRGSRDQYLPQ